MQQQNLYLYSGRRVAYSLFLAGLLLLLPWATHFYAHFVDSSLLRFGMRPWDPAGFVGIVTMPFLHGGTDHLVSNSIPFLVLGAGLFFYYRDVAWRVLGFIVLFTGVTLWFIGIPGSNHIGASGVVYGLVGFHLMGGVIRRNRHLMAFAMLVVFLYGGFIWSIFPDFFPDRNISWEGHLTGLAAGVIMAFRCRGKGPEPDPVLPDDDDDDDDDDEDIEHIEHIASAEPFPAAVSGAVAESNSASMKSNATVDHQNGDHPSAENRAHESSHSTRDNASTTAGQRPVRYHVS